MEEFQMEKPKGSKKGLWALIVIIVAIIFGIAGYLIGKNVSPKAPDQPAALTAVVESATATIASLSPVSTTSTDVTANWKTYTNDTYGFSFKYPTTFETKNNNKNSVDLTEIGKPMLVEGAEMLPFLTSLELNGASDASAIDIANSRKISTDIGTPTATSYNLASFDAAKGTDYLKTVFYVKLNNGNLFTFTIVNVGDESNQARLSEIADQILSTFQLTK